MAHIRVFDPACGVGQYASLRKLPEALTLLANLDTSGLLAPATSVNVDENALLAELGVDLIAPAETADPDDITVLLASRWILTFVRMTRFREDDAVRVATAQNLN